MIYPIVSPKVEYSLTEFDKTLIPVIVTLGQWGSIPSHCVAELADVPTNTMVKTSTI